MKGLPVNDAINEIGVGFYQLVILVLGGGIYASEGALLLIIGHVGKGLVHEWDLTPIHAGSMAMAVFVGLTFGTLMGGFACDAVGRRSPVLATYVGIILCLTFCLLGGSYVALCIGFAFLGVFMGFGLPAANAIVCESCPDAHRSHIYCVTMVLFACGQMYAAAVMWIHSPRLSHEVLHWRMMLAYGMVLPALLLAASYFFLLESAYWLVLNDRDEDAERKLSRMAKCNGRSKQFQAFMDSQKASAKEAPIRHTPRRQLSGNLGGSGPGGNGEDVPLIKKEDSQEEVLGCKDRFRALFSPYYRATTIIMTYVCFSTNLSYYGMIYGLPHTFRSLEKSGDVSAEVWSPGAGVFVAALFEVPGVILAVILASTISRKANMCFSFMASTACIIGVVVAYAYEQMDTIGLWCVFGVKMFIASGFIVSYLYLLEFYPTIFRATGLAFCMVVGRIGALLSPFLYDGLVWSGLGFIWFFFVVAVVVTLAALATLVLPHETKDAPLNEV